MTNQVRHRRQSGIRDLDDAVFVASEAKIDRLKVPLLVKIGYANVDQINDYISAISGEEGFLPNHIFKVRSQRTPHSRELSIRDGFLFSGRGKISNVASCGPGTATIQMMLEVNPTRFLSHQPSGVLFENGDIYGALTRNAEYERQTRAASLDGNDNVLLGASRNGSTIFVNRDYWWNGITADYLARIERLLEFNLIPNPTNDLPSVTVHHFDLGSPQQAELYWEFDCPDAISWVLAVADRVSIAAGQMQLRRYLSNASQTGVGHDENGTSVMIGLKPTSGDTTLCIYAKTPTRVRFEIKYLKNIRQSVAHHCRGVLPITEILNRAKEDASRKMERVYSAIGRVSRPSSFDRTDLIDLLDAIYWSVDHNREAGRSLVSLLVNIGAISETVPEGMVPRRVLERLSARGVVSQVKVRHGGVRRYALTPTYAALRQALLAVLPDRQTLMTERLAYRLQ